MLAPQSRKKSIELPYRYRWCPRTDFRTPSTACTRMRTVKTHSVELIFHGGAPVLSWITEQCPSTAANLSQDLDRGSGVTVVISHAKQAANARVCFAGCECIKHTSQNKSFSRTVCKQPKCSPSAAYDVQRGKEQPSWKAALPMPVQTLRTVIPEARDSTSARAGSR